MGKQVSVRLEDNLHKKLQKIQKDFIATYNEPISFSNVLNEILNKGLQ